MISTTSELVGLLDRLESGGATVPGIDLEADNLHRYAEQLCLVQVTDGERYDLVDPLAIEDLAPLGKYLETATLWMHGADFDMTLFKREFNLLPEMIFDTQIAARLLGVRKFSYANLVDQYFDVQLSKSSQKENWGQRPLPDKMCEYALNDVRYLLPLGQKLEDELHEKGRHRWFLESCEAAMAKVRARDDQREDPWRIQGSGKLDRQGLAILKTIWEWRDGEACSWDRPAFMVARNKQLIDWSLDLLQDNQPSIPHNFKGGRLRRLHEAMKVAKSIPKDEWPERPKRKGRRWADEQEEEFRRHAERRDVIAEELDIDPSMLAPRSVIERLVWKEEEPSALLLPWQRELLGV
jgi:ribonuclease D